MFKHPIQAFMGLSDQTTGLIGERLKKGKCFPKVVVMIGHCTLRLVLDRAEIALDFGISSYVFLKLG